VTLPPDASSAGQAVDTRVPLLPLTLQGERLGVRSPPPSLGEHSQALLQELGYDAAQVGALIEAGVVGGG
jgi:crotonobetainyl-CoA:carnitine CoA-transferase CaiB-like acyl-CoA transferase